jgi:phosphatidate cytidylyltransferase
LIPLVLAAVAWECPIAIWVLAMAAIFLGIAESAALVDGTAWESVLGFLIFIGAPLSPYFFGARDYQIALTVATLVGVGILLYTTRQPARRPAGPREFLASAGAALWCAAPLTSLVLLHQLGLPKEMSYGWRFATPVSEVLLPIWAGDTAAYFVGRAWGRHLLAPSISPKKTWEGAVANLLACIGVGIPVGLWIGYAWPIGLACGCAIGALGQAGDLFESHLKRRAGTKDSGALLPGHGGLLDRIDSLLFSAPAVALVLSFATTRV